ncbi:somatic embryogenesis receptor kinase 2-like [Panicum miliaceum]|uniref:Somatic embryogenesis receptor kinase 2-like n=1 Tax=Panicum miliaceum TaxID=4540 RepID=A0A3L6R703_PANMI|nr:somatic embryogenesis receptor kinase 2-like [Panicum miliaceum]
MALVAATRTASLAAAVLIVAMVAAASLEPAAANKDADALTALRSGLKDPDGALASWDPSLVNPCTWFHVTCDGSNRVIRLDLGKQKLSGPLAPELGQLDQLQFMYGPLNHLMAFFFLLPMGIPSVSRECWEIYENNIEGRIPSELGGLAHLVGLDLHGNRISGPIPLALGNIQSLKLLDLSSNGLCGTIPTSGAFKDIPASSFANNPRLHQGGNYEPNC